MGRETYPTFWSNLIKKRAETEGIGSDCTELGSTSVVLESVVADMAFKVDVGETESEENPTGVDVDNQQLLVSLAGTSVGL